MDFNFFEWIRQGVKRSVLLGVSDAVNQMGMPHDDDETREKILGFLQSDNAKNPSLRRRLSVPTDTNRKLGRSLTDLNIGTGEN